MDFGRRIIPFATLPGPLGYRWLIFANTFFILGFTAYSTDARTDCAESDFQECLKEFDTIISHQELGFAASEKELNQACRHLKEGVNCIDGFVKRCTKDKTQLETLTVSVKGAFDILELLCENTYHRNQYLKHAECYRQIASEIEECMHPMRTMGLRQQHREQYTKSKLDHMVCCAYHNATECIHRVSTKRCSDRAATFLKNYTDRAAYPITQQCRTFNNTLCSKPSSSPGLLPLSWLVVLPFVVYII
ncbi:uncharacterized protein LOC129588147 [Paramacrobiotus metropolitanus]|uniref:uncharacterized protein LOC129588147 n=1 Tax=Paramacrobiotus metropolitanus TaxID=2943436 RepID=UPI00244604E5|nr:uncharacterized protein LOC129588147 [Paramacrobiotus metropolitanus]XP_055338235.1 uncharacterized protein LOC129588147 [Paramacrobiotus metropolitanus]XP_055338236.1 uncharacterized protein LOC129588147 [Paramacrobiotus metropolitanus]